ncbi:hypothetical protein [Nitrospira sp. BLG_2]|uniref:hypothetical protein n=1 Tax=Nitrospira sp. BLG_2 TaxID=3397507 RepID=UPI003B99E5F9
MVSSRLNHRAGRSPVYGSGWEVVVLPAYQYSILRIFERLSGDANGGVCTRRRELHGAGSNSGVD